MRRAPCGGFTVLEMVAATLVLAAATAAVGSVVAGMARTNGAVVEQAADGAAAAAALEALQRDLRAVTGWEAVEEGFLRARLGGRTVSWRLAGGRVVRNEGGRDRAHGRNVTGFTVERRGRLVTVHLRGDARLDGLVPAWEVSATAAPRVEAER